MTQTKPSSVLESVSGNIITGSALTVLAAISGGPLAALLPVLATSLASGRQKERVEKALVDINLVLERHAIEIRDLTDEQYKIINETVLTLFQTTHSEKLKYLRAVIENAIVMQDIQPQEAAILSRVVRDISAEEATFVINNFSFEGFHLMATSPEQHFTDNILRINPTSRDALKISGLLSFRIAFTCRANL